MGPNMHAKLGPTTLTDMCPAENLGFSQGAKSWRAGIGNALGLLPCSKFTPSICMGAAYMPTAHRIHQLLVILVALLGLRPEDPQHTRAEDAVHSSVAGEESDYFQDLHPSTEWHCVNVGLAVTILQSQGAWMP